MKIQSFKIFDLSSNPDHNFQKVRIQYLKDNQKRCLLVTVLKSMKKTEKIKAARSIFKKFKKQNLL